VFRQNLENVDKVPEGHMTSSVLSPLTRVLTYGTCVGLTKVLKGVC
jgi:hypothetical protein